MFKKPGRASVLQSHMNGNLQNAKVLALFVFGMLEVEGLTMVHKYSSTDYTFRPPGYSHLAAILTQSTSQGLRSQDWTEDNLSSVPGSTRRKERTDYHRSSSDFRNIPHKPKKYM